MKTLGMKTYQVKEVGKTIVYHYPTNFIDAMEIVKKAMDNGVWDIDLNVISWGIIADEKCVTYRKQIQSWKRLLNKIEFFPLFDNPIR